jgi:photosystem II stability/assembly factor-like uncharacterized protein
VNRLTILSALALALLSSTSHAVRAPNTSEEADDTAQQREQYFMMRRTAPYGVQFNAAQARLKAYQQFLTAITAEKTDPSVIRAMSAQLHSEVWQNIGPGPIVEGQTPTDASASSRSAVSGRVNAVAIDGIDGAVYIGGAQGGVWRSLDHGNNWVPLTDYLGSLAIGTIALAPGSHPLNQGTIYIGTGEANFSGDSFAGIGIYKSTDSGLTWQGPLGSAQFINRAVSSIVVDATNTQVVLAGSSTGYAGVEGDIPPNPASRGIYRSTDGGTTWAKVFPSGSSELRISRIVQDPSPAFTAPNTRFWAAATLNGTVGGALLRSDNGGQTWTVVDGVATGLPQLGTANALTRTWITTTYAGGNTVLYLGTSDVPASQSASGNGGTLFKSSNGGTTWAKLGAADGFCQTQCFYDMPVYVEAGSATTLYTGGAGTGGDGSPLPTSFMQSTDGGATFVDELGSVDGNSALHADIHDITTWPGAPNEVWVGNDGGVFYSTDRGAHWNSANTNEVLTQFQICDLHPTDPNQAYGGTQDNGTDSFLGTTAWSHSDDGDGGFALIDQQSPSLVTHTYFNESNYLIGASLATNGPASAPNDYYWFVGEEPGYLASGMNPNDDVLFYAPMHLDRNLQSTLYFGTDHLYIAPDFFNQTITQEDALTGNPPYTIDIFSPLGGNLDFGQAVSPSTTVGAISAIETQANVVPGINASTIFVGTSNGNVWRSTDSGATFTNVDPSIAQYVSQIAIYPRNPNIVIEARAGFSGGTPAHNMRISTDGGTTWADASDGLPDIPVNTVIWDPVFPGQVWAGTDIGMYLSTDEGATWHPYNNGMPNVAVFSLAGNRITHTVLACTHGRGAFRLNLDAIFIDGFDGN